MNETISHDVMGNITSLVRTTALIPNLYSANPGDNRNATSIRGIRSAGYEPAVAIYIDGVNQFNLDMYTYYS